MIVVRAYAMLTVLALMFVPGDLVQSKVVEPSSFQVPPSPYVEGLHYQSRRLTEVQRLHILENELLDPHRNILFDSELQKEIASLRRSIERVVIATCGCN